MDHGPWSSPSPSTRIYRNALNPIVIKLTLVQIVSNAPDHNYVLLLRFIKILTEK
jgi:hypothetical protein